jgi:hypothetical protein
MPPLDELGCRRLKLTDPLSPPAAPVVYLTEWTFVAACTYMGLASFASLTLLLDERDRVTNTNSLEGAFNHAAQFSEVQLASGEGWYLWATNVAFHIAVVLEPCIVIGVLPREIRHVKSRENHHLNCQSPPSGGDVGLRSVPSPFVRPTPRRTVPTQDFGRWFIRKTTSVRSRTATQFTALEPFS